jgi:hypothetical protein
MHVKKDVLCCKFPILSNHNFFCFHVFYIYTKYWKHLYLQKCRSFSLEIRVKSSFCHPVFERSGCRMSNSTAIFLPDVSDVWKWPIFKDVAFSRKSASRLKLRTLIAMYEQFISISAVKSFVLFPFTGDYLNLKICTMLYLLEFF